MKKIICMIFTVGLFLQYVFSNDVLLSKFHQNAYKIKDVRIQLMSYDQDFYYFFEIKPFKPFKYNRTTTAHNITMRFKVTIKDYAEILIQAYKFLSNEYRHFPLRFQVNGKKSIDANVMGMGQMAQRCGNMDVTYHMCNFVVDEKHLPPLIPYGKYRVDGTILYFKKKIAQVAMFGEVYEPIVYPKK